MHEPRYKSLWQWEPFPYLLLFVLAVAAGTIRPDVAPTLFWIALVLVVAAAGYLVAALVADRRRARLSPDAWGNLAGLDGLEIIEAEHVASELNPVAAVADTHRHQAAIEIAGIHGGEAMRAILVPRASRWLSLRYRIGVQLQAGGVIKHAGFVPDAVDARWRDELGALRRRGAFVSVPARITGAGRPFGVELDLSGLAAAAASAAESSGAEA